MGTFLVINMIFGMMATGIDMAAHVGGLITGFVCGLILSQPLSSEMIARRRFRNAVVSAAGCITLLLWVLALPHIPRATALSRPPPECTSVEVTDVLAQVIRSTPIGPTLKSIDGHREVRYDSEADVRHGECVAHTDTGRHSRQIHRRMAGPQPGAVSDPTFASRPPLAPVLQVPVASRISIPDGRKHRRFR